MTVELKRATERDTKIIWTLQREAFAALLEKYEDYETSPGNESIEKTRARLLHEDTYFYWIFVEEKPVGAIRVIDFKDDRRKRIAPIFIMPRYQNKGYAQQAIREAERIHGASHWMLDTILQESKLCHLYEKMGYHKTGETEKVNEKMDVVYYEKD